MHARSTLGVHLIGTFIVFEVHSAYTRRTLLKFGAHSTNIILQGTIQPFAPSFGAAFRRDDS